MIEILIASLCVMLASLAGVLFIWKGVGKAVSRNLHYLVSLSAGVFLVVSYQLGMEVLHLAGSWVYGAAWILLGIIAFWAVFKFFPAFHHHGDDCNKGHHSRLDARRILAGDAVHNIGDGVLIATAFAISPALGAVTASSVFVHEFVQEVSEFFVLKQSGYSTKKALLINFLVSSTILAGAVGSTLLFEVFSPIQIPLMGITAGAFLVVVFQDLIPHSVREARVEANHFKHVGWFVVGVIIMFSVNVIAVHSHGSESHDHDRHPHAEEHHAGDRHEHDAH